MSDGIIEAVVQVGAQETRYLRCGRGDQVIVVLAEDAAERLNMLCHYAQHHRVIAPVPDECPDPNGTAGLTMENWLLGVIDGLGLDQPAIVLAPGLAQVAERLTQADMRVLAPIV